ncbi:hypothetical protein [Aquimarina macrocephali]|uniref:hypothetical protein n=1 Tax=Aquimarina macrocephali TaxID=666563 RepID=UPI003F67130E
MKKTILIFALIGISFGVKAQDWPSNNGYIYFGTNTLDQSQAGNYAVLQEKSNGNTFLNSPTMLSLRINNSDKLVINEDGVSFTNGFTNNWPYSAAYIYFGTNTLDQSQVGNYALLQEKSNGNTFLNSPTMLSLRINNSNKLIITNNGKVGIGTDSPDSKLTVKGKIHAEEVKIDLSVPAPDYVFTKEYDLLTIEEVQQHIKEKGHLPNIPSATEMEQNGVELGVINMKLLEKIEELTLYTIAQEKQLKEQQKVNKALEDRLKKIEGLLLK